MKLKKKVLGNRTSKNINKNCKKAEKLKKKRNFLIGRLEEDSNNYRIKQFYNKTKMRTSKLGTVARVAGTNRI